MNDIKFICHDKNVLKNFPIVPAKDCMPDWYEKLEDKNTLEGSVEEYQKLIKLNLLIEKEFQKASKELSQSTREKIQKVLKKNEKKTR